MKTEQIAYLIAGLFILVFGMQAYTTYQINHRLQQVLEESSANNSIQLRIPKFPLPKTTQPQSQEDLSKNPEWNPYQEMQHIQDEMAQIFGQSVSRFHHFAPFHAVKKTPDVDLQDLSDRYIVRVNAPGADQASLKINLDENRLSISIKTETTQAAKDDKNDHFEYRERFNGELFRLITLPGKVDKAKLSSEFTNGVLTITLPKLPA